MKSIFLISFTLLFSIFIVSCGDKSDSKSASPEITSVQNDGVRSGSKGMMSAAYFTLITDHAVQDTLIDAETSVAGDVQIHESYVSEDGLAGMREMGPLPVTRGDSLIFKRGGVHLMLFDLQSDLDPGDKVSIDLIFSSGSRHTTVLSVFDNK